MNRRKSVFPVLFVLVMLLCVLFIAWYLPTVSSMRFRLQDGPGSCTGGTVPRPAPGRPGRKKKKGAEGRTQAAPPGEKGTGGKTRFRIGGSGTMNKQLKIILSIALIMSVMLMVVCGLNLFSLRSQLKDVELRLEESRNTWEAIDADKRALQDDLKLVNNNLKDASQSLSEWAEQSVSMQQEVEELRTQVESLKNGAK